MPKQIALGLSPSQIGGYLFVAGTILEQFHGEGFQAVGGVIQGLGLGLETGQGSFGPIPFNIPQQDGVYITDGGVFIETLFGSPGMQAAGLIIIELGSGVTTGVGTVGPIRIGSEGLTLSIANNQLTGTLAPWG